MTCEEARSLFSPYIDSELEPSVENAIDHHLISCHSCQEFYEEHNKIEAALKKYLTTDSDVQRAWRQAKGRIMNRSSRWERVSRNSGLATLAILLLVVGWFARNTQSHDLFKAAYANHVKYVSDELPLNLFSHSAQEVEEYFQGKLPFDVKVPEFMAGNNVQLIGARLCHIKKMPVAYLVYHVDNKPVSLFIMDQECAFEFHQIKRQEREKLLAVQCYQKGENVIAFKKVNNAFICVFGAVPMDSLTKLALAY